MMPTRNEITLNITATNGRTVTIKAMDAVGPEDAYNVLFRAVVHRIATGEDVIAPTPREVKDWCIKTNLYI
jgi:hypothetical protein